MTVRSSSGWRSASSAGRANSSSSSRKSTPLCASVISPGRTRGPAADEPGGRHRVVRRAERAARARARAPPSWPGDRVDHRRLERLVEGERRQDAGQAAREHRLARAGRADEEQVVAARGGDLERAPRHLLPAHVGEVARAGGRAGVDGAAARGTARRRRSPSLAAQQRDELAEVGAPRGPRSRPRRPPRPRSRGGTTSAAHAARARPRRDGQHAAHGPQRAVERELAHEQRVRRAPPASSTPAAHSMPTAIGTSKAAPSLRRSAGARLTVILRGGSLKPLFSSAPRMRTRPSRTPASASPTMWQPGRPTATSTSTSMGAASMPMTAAEATRASMRAPSKRSAMPTRRAARRGAQNEARRPGAGRRVPVSVRCSGPRSGAAGGESGPA